MLSLDGWSASGRLYVILPEGEERVLVRSEMGAYEDRRGRGMVERWFLVPA